VIQLAKERQREVAAAFDVAAGDYDDKWTCSVSGRLQREQVWRKVDRVFLPGHKILDLGCGTGADAAHLARVGVQVLAIDISPQMVRMTRQRVESQNLSEAVTCEILALEDLGDLKNKGSFDGAISDFGVLNCVENLRQVALDLASLLRPGAHLALCYMGRFCLWETAWFLLHGKPGKAFRRFAARREVHFSVARAFEVVYPSMRKIVEAFRDNFRLVSWRGVGIFVPPSCVEPLAHSFQGGFRRLAWFDRIAGGWAILRALGDHRLLVFVRN
jgi:ubiquinone/menaquinone biosynthesis C-methylase UbiE